MNFKKYKFEDISKYRNQIYGIGTIMILMFHLQSIGGTLIHNPSNKILKYLEFVNEMGSLAVDLFLLLSGVGLYFSYTKNPDATHFIKNRMKRLAPAFCGIIFPMSLLMLVVNKNKQVFLFRITATHFFINGNRLIWYISLLICLYFMYPYIYSFLFKDKSLLKNLCRLVILLVSIIVLTSAIYKYDSTFFWNYEIALTRIPVFLVGCFLGRIVYEKKEISVLWVFVSAVALVLVYVSLYNEWKMPVSWRYKYCFSAISITVVASFLCKFMPKFVNAILGFFGERSLEMYLFNVMVNQFYLSQRWFPIYKGSRLVYLILIIIDILLATIVHKLSSVITHRLQERKNRRIQNVNAKK